MFQNASLARSRKRVFNSVFAPVILTENAPTPLATPALASSAQGQAFGSVKLSGTASNIASTEEEPEPEGIIWSRAWHAATEFLVLPDRTYDTLSSFVENATSLSLQPKQITSEIERSLSYLLSPSSHSGNLHQGIKEYDLVEWYCNELRRHFVTNLRAVLGAVGVHTVWSYYCTYMY
jgi:anaphase-promoting complex subunit 2